MPSPFPGMDPYLEAPEIWPDFHDALATEIRNRLNQTLPAPYYARLEMRPELGIVETGHSRKRIVPDVVVLGQRADLSRSFQASIPMETLRHHFVEIRDAVGGHKLVTLIEILSPSNKRPGPDHRAYERKQREILESVASLIEIDLLRTGDRILPSLELNVVIDQLEPALDYLVLISRAWQRTPEELGYQGFPVGLREWLPCIPVPLRQGEPEVALDLQFVFNRAYEGSPYQRGAVNYEEPSEPLLAEADLPWARHNWFTLGYRPGRANGRSMGG